MRLNKAAEDCGDVSVFKLLIDSVPRRSFSYSEDVITLSEFLVVELNRWKIHVNYEQSQYKREKISSNWTTYNLFQEGTGKWYTAIGIKKTEIRFMLKVW